MISAIAPVGCGARSALGGGNDRQRIGAREDHQGSVRDLVNSSGTILHHVQYDSFGERDDVIGCLFGYTGQYHDPLTKLQLHCARWYDPAVGRFISEDPSELGPDTNMYRYCGNGPINNVDPTG